MSTNSDCLEMPQAHGGDLQKDHLVKSAGDRDTADGSASLDTSLLTQLHITDSIITPSPQNSTPALPTASQQSRRTIGNRLQRMFSQGSRVRDMKGETSGKEKDGNGSDNDAGVAFTAESRKHSFVAVPALEQATRKASIVETTLKRFDCLDNGYHAHHLRSAKRQEKITHMLRELLMGKKRADHVDDNLSLLSSWADQLKHEKLASEKKGGPNSTPSLLEKYGKCQEIIGRGAFGIVRISHKTDATGGTPEQLYAVKEFRRRPNETERKYHKRLNSEFCISSSLRHQNIIHTLDLLQDQKGDYCEVMEFCPGGDLYTLILAVTKLEVAEADCFFKQLMRGVEYMHEMGVAHRDLKPENLLLTTDGVLKITDFGNGECFRMAWETEAHMTGGLCGSAPYIAPEEYTDKEFDPRAVDVWATGVIYMAMRTGRHLWRVAKRDEDEFYESYLAGRRGEAGYLPIQSLQRARCRNVIYSILDPNPSRRLTASEVLKSEWGRDIQLCKAAEEAVT